MTKIFYRQQYRMGANDIPVKTTLEFQRGRFIMALILLVVLLGSGIVCSLVPVLSAWSTVLYNAFSLVLGIVIGLLKGESNNG